VLDALAGPRRAGGDGARLGILVIDAGVDLENGRAEVIGLPESRAAILRGGIAGAATAWALEASGELRASRRRAPPPNTLERQHS